MRDAGLFELLRLQRGLEELYRIETELDVSDFLIDADTRASIGLARHSREQLILNDTGGVALFVCEAALRNLAENDPGVRVDESNVSDLLLAIEGVSHFVYLAWRARSDHSVSGLELELQAEVDKYVTLLLVDANLGDSQRIRRRLFHEFEYEPDLDDEERERYVIANDAARRYSSWLERNFIHTDRKSEMLAEVRRFYRLPLSEKLSAC